jgi:hypothetical protein
MIRVKLVFSLPNTGMWDFIIVSPKDVDQWLRRWIDYGYVLSGPRCIRAHLMCCWLWYIDEDIFAQWYYLAPY